MAPHFENAALPYSSHSPSSSSSSPLPDFRIPLKDLPRELYRVHCPGQSKTSYTSSDGFRCSSKRVIDIRGAEFIPTLISHLNWYSASPSPFISTFRNKSHAYGWADRFFNNNPGSDSVFIMKIDPREIRSKNNTRMPVVEVKNVVDRMRRNNSEIIPDQRTYYQVEDEYVCLYIIPAGAITDVEEYKRESPGRNNDTRALERTHRHARSSRDHSEKRASYGRTYNVPPAANPSRNEMAQVALGNRGLPHKKAPTTALPRSSNLEQRGRDTQIRSLEDPSGRPGAHNLRRTRIENSEIDHFQVEADARRIGGGYQQRRLSSPSLYKPSKLRRFCRILCCCCCC
ncbi:hypothetical protein TWF730_010424 [Orbilia blumenaviensis]|uniref:DUF7587 domain-containing protein n=1 Tax=Orbilia blumenaviensis TaxID=1796055 RepID=A0AAV9UN80_9PEZI